MNRLKTFQRTSMGDDLLNDVMFIRLHGGELKDFDPHRAISLWMGRYNGDKARGPRFDTTM